MAEQERVRERERPPIADNIYERNMRQRKEFVERNKSGPIVIKRSDRQLFQARQGKLLRSPTQQAVARYRPRPYDGRLLLFACDVPVPTRPRPIAPGWRRVASDLTVVPVPGGHDDLLRDPAPLAVVARAVTQHLAAIDT